MMRITFAAIILAIGAASFTGGRFMGAYEQAATDKAQSAICKTRECLSKTIELWRSNHA